MKPCPLCREEIQDDAIKCRHCQSLLISIESSKGEAQDQNKQITYVLDRDLVRFAKFAGAVLGVLLVAGTYLFGFRLESALDEMDDAQEELSATQEELSAAKQTVSNLKRDVEQVLQEARGQLGSITETKQRADELYIAISNQRPGDSESASPDCVLKLWQAGRTISVGFFDGSQSARAAVDKIAREWTERANIKFDFVAGSNADIRISFRPGGVWSYVGTDALVIPKSQPTMALIEAEEDDEAFRSAVLRNFGLALGLINEHSNPRADIKWNKEAVYRYYSAPPYNWTKQAANLNLFAKCSSVIPLYREFDPDSVMMLPIPSSLTLDAFEVSNHSELSAGDKALIAKLYPRK